MNKIVWNVYHAFKIFLVTTCCKKQGASENSTDPSYALWLASPRDLEISAVSLEEAGKKWPTRGDQIVQSTNSNEWASPMAPWQRICLQCRRQERCEFDPWVGKIPWRRKWQPTPVFLPRKFHGQRSLVGYSPWGHRVRHDWVCMHTHVCVRTHTHNYNE